MLENSTELSLFAIGASLSPDFENDHQNEVQAKHLSHGAYYVAQSQKGELRAYPSRGMETVHAAGCACPHNHRGPALVRTSDATQTPYETGKQYVQVGSQVRELKALPGPSHLDYHRRSGSYGPHQPSILKGDRIMNLQGSYVDEEALDEGFSNQPPKRAPTAPVPAPAEPTPSFWESMPSEWKTLLYWLAVSAAIMQTIMVLSCIGCYFRRILNVLWNY